MQEKWVFVNDTLFKTKYQISDLGRIKNATTNNILKGGISGGYKSIVLKNENIIKNHKIHILVAKTFLVNNDINKIYVNHKDGNKFNNNLNNLEWVTPSENVLHAKDNGLIKYYTRKINQYNKQNNLIKSFDSIKEASKYTNINYTNIYGCCSNLRKTAGGFIWKYAQENINKSHKFKKNDIYKIEEFDNYYVTRNGQIFNNKTNKFLKLSKTEDGYLCINLRKIEKGKILKNKKILIHREVAKGFVSNPSNNQIVNHINLNKQDNNYKNLEWTTSSQNTLHYHKNK